MEFTYKEYVRLLELIRENNYTFADFENHFTVERPVILRHDIDMSLAKALILAELENAKGVCATYFVLLCSDFYNVFSKQSNEILKRIYSLGHPIGLHFDEKRYAIETEEDLKKCIDREIGILERELDIEIRAVSMHRPSRWILDNDLQLDGLVNTYSAKFFHHFKYFSDSRMHWREDVYSAIRNKKFDRLHILTHPFWYAEERGTIEERLAGFINQAQKERYWQIKDNLTDLNKIIAEEEYR